MKINSNNHDSLLEPEKESIPVHFSWATSKRHLKIGEELKSHFKEAIIEVDLPLNVSNEKDKIRTRNI